MFSTGAARELILPHGDPEERCTCTGRALASRGLDLSCHAFTALTGGGGIYFTDKVLSSKSVFL